MSDNDELLRRFIEENGDGAELQRWASESKAHTEAVREQASMLWWKAKLLKQEFSEGQPLEPVPEPPPPVQYPPVPRQWEPMFQQNLGLIVGSMLIGISVGLWLSEFEFVRKEY